MIKILAIDDNYDNLIVLKTLINDVFPDSTYFSALNVLTGIDIAVVEDPDVILLDIVMSDMDGFNVCRRLKKHEQLKKIPVVFVTSSHISNENRIKGLEVGGNAFLSKPIDKIELTAQIKAMIKMKLSSDQRNDKNRHSNNLIFQCTQALEEKQSVLLNLLDELKAENESYKRTVAILKASETVFRNLFENSPVGILRTGLDGSLAANRSFSEIVGYSEEELRTKNWKDITHPDDTRISKKTADSLLKKEVSVTRFEKRYIHKNGKIVWTEVSVFLQNDQNGEPKFFITTILDITKRMHTTNALRESEKHFWDLFENAPIGIFYSTISGQFLKINPAFVKILGYSSKEELVTMTANMTTQIYFNPQRRAQILDLLLNIDGWVHDEVIWKRKDGTNITVDITGRKVLNIIGEVAFVEGFVVDITERNTMLCDLMAAKERAENSDKLKTAFMQNISHEIRTPLNGIIGFGELLASNDLTEKERNIYFEIMKKSSDRLVRLINDYMDISLIVSGNMKVTKVSFPINHLLDDILNTVYSKCAVKDLTLSADRPSLSNIMIDTDYSLLYKILDHLIDNAIKFTAKGKISMGYILKDENVLFFIKDTGVGIHKEDIIHISNYFIQEGVLNSRNYEGNGLGFPISKGLARLLGGKIYLESDKGVGSNFYVMLPLK